MEVITAFFYAFLAISTILIVILIFSLFSQYNECKSSGGEMVGTGEYYTTTTMIMVGKVFVPMTQTHERTECRHKETGDKIEIN